MTARFPFFIPLVVALCLFFQQPSIALAGSALQPYLEPASDISPVTFLMMGGFGVGIVFTVSAMVIRMGPGK